MVVKSQIKLIKSLHLKKNRQLHERFIIEGVKGVEQALSNGLIPHLLCATTPNQLAEAYAEFRVQIVSAKELSQISALKNPSGFLGVFQIPKPQPVDYSDWVLALDGVQDPGNLGTIIRLCDWFGVRHILCALGTVDAYNPKVVQATMGSIGRVQLHYVDLAATLASTPVEVLGTFMEGQPISNAKFTRPGIVVMGNEGQGISKEIAALVSRKISIPAHYTATTESLNVANAAGIVMYEIRRSIL